MTERPGSDWTTTQRIFIGFGLIDAALIVYEQAWILGCHFLGGCST